MKLQFCKLYTVIEKSSQEKKDVASSHRDVFGLTSTTTYPVESCRIIDESLDTKTAACISTSIHAPLVMTEILELFRRVLR
jgi:hypothetical protein